MATVTYILRRGQPLTEEQKAELEALKQMSDDDIICDEDCPDDTANTENYTLSLHDALPIEQAAS